MDRRQALHSRERARRRNRLPVLTDRVAYFALERLVIGTPETQAVEVERVLNQLQRQIDRYRTLLPTWVREPSLAANH